MVYDLTELNVYQYMLSVYNNPQCTGIEEFEDDAKRIKYIKRLINRYSVQQDTKERLLLNHIISFYNVFGLEASTRILFLKIEDKDYSILKTYLTFLNYMPHTVEMVNGKNIIDSNIPINQKIVDRLREI